ncbi:MAG: tetratricopeptide repeat protein, partial [bacterium]
GSIYRNKGAYTEALEYYEKAVKIKPDYTVCIDNMGITYFMMGEFDRAEEQYLKASSIDASYADSHYNLGALYEAGDKKKDALAEYEKYISLSKDNEKIQEVRGIVERLRKELQESAR